MSKAPPAKGVFGKRSLVDRVGMLKARTREVHEHAVGLLWANESNRFINYSQVLQKQIPMSYAAHAFNLFRDQMHQIVVVKFCAIWDGPGEDRINIATLVDLLESPDVLETLMEERRQYTLNRPVADLSPPQSVEKDEAAHVEAMRRFRVRQADEDVQRARQRILDAVRQAKEMMASDEFRGLMNLRHKLAHRLVVTKAEKVGPIPPAKYGDETKLIENTISIVEDLNLGINDTGYDWKGTREQIARSTEELWGNCAFNIFSPDERYKSAKAEKS